MSKRYSVDPQFAHERAKLAARARTTPDYYLGKLTALLPSLTVAQARRLAKLAALARTQAGAS